ncbi:ArgE/DapE family deacylase [Candidatus Bathyarchaeota archaeon]|jgi:acetylornithine deacetylase|nr:ArgE/DapE family deacylase [Candidatus Bathyarchaeota archaeon]MBT4319909.1 ArgE/DapE family deacylase [Candidatus Bathyarchaeota archaeon]MBT4422831.1 ArgE/DapE family deacylase [Candidatus Bathyarchaeota archaeon]MBT5643389.1 ArgE/DapE family deacylase [Candidatus Bathyarchaeota archaeon]MBT6605746.1 ArgE/DapE family deacylase [Candidatus Bathyarchaeota archaeon]
MNAVEIAKELIKFDTSGPPTQEQPCAEWIRDFLDDIGFRTTLQVVEPGRANVIGKIGEGKEPGLVLSGHIDVVLAGDPDLWKVSRPFEPVEKEGYLYGRGACDMKGPDACMLQVAQDYAKEDYKRQLTMVFTAGEDTGGWFVDRVIEDKLVTPAEAKYCVIGEPSLMEIIPVHKGSGGADIMIHGRASHSSKPELGINANQKAADFLYELRGLQEELNKEKHPLLGSTTVECTLMEGGFKANIIPDQAKLTINYRLIPTHKEPEVSKGWFTSIIEKLSRNDPEFKAELTSHRASNPLDVPLDSEIVTTLKDILGTEPVGEPYYTEAVSYTSAGIPAIICGPGSIDQAHTPDEYISLEQLSLGYKTYKELVKRTCL